MSLAMYTNRYTKLLGIFGPNADTPMAPVTGLDLRLGNYFVRVLGLTPKGRHVHYEVLRPRRRKNQAPDRRWMPTRKFMREATVAGYFKRDSNGILGWFEPQVGVDLAAVGTSDMSIVAKVSYTPEGGVKLEYIAPHSMYAR